MPHLLCLGDSITDCGRLFDSPPLGNGYVQKLSRKLTANGQHWKITNCGVDGFTIARLLSNAEPFYLPQKADIITILIGINDIGLMMNTRRTSAQQKEMLELALKHYEELLHVLARSDTRFVLMEPFLFPYPEEYKTWIPHVRSLSRGIGTLAEKYRIPYLLLHEELNKKASMQGIHTLTTDGIHLTDTGHEILADLLYQHLTASLLHR
ncbi:MAG: GDSL-type esterase/lipase family protein [Eubacteriales bacterium]|nr:GDSL-type esterase/lipase family protein [Eubacteriales bacterium]